MAASCAKFREKCRTGRKRRSRQRVKFRRVQRTFDLKFEISRARCRVATHRAQIKVSKFQNVFVQHGKNLFFDIFYHNNYRDRLDTFQQINLSFTYWLCLGHFNGKLFFTFHSLIFSSISFHLSRFGNDQKILSLSIFPR